jgi:DNA polymerase III delta prime subunit
MRFIRRKGQAWSPTATVAMKPVAKMTWEERQQALVEGMKTKRRPRFLYVNPVFSSLRLPMVLSIEGQWVLFTLDGGVTAYMWGRDRRNELLSLLQTIVNQESETDDDVQVARAGMFSLTSIGDKKVGWTRIGDVQPRSKSTLALEGDMMEDMLQDARAFFSQTEIYQKRQQPYRRGWLLHGPPGTGKSTTPQVMATELNVPVYILPLSFPDVTDMALDRLLHEVPVESIVLMEDVDVASGATIQRSSMDMEPRKSSGGTDSVSLRSCYSSTEAPPSLTLGGLLNALDGVGAHVGHLTIMTTNAASALDPALKRPGRMDRVFHLDFATAEQVRTMAKQNFPDASLTVIDDLCNVVMPAWFSPAAVCAYFRSCETPEDAIRLIAELEKSRPLHTDKALQNLIGNERLCKFDEMWASGREGLYPLWNKSSSGVIDMFGDSPHGTTPLTAGDIIKAFLAVFPEQRVVAARFAERTCEWMRRHPTLQLWRGRLVAYLQTHCICPVEALEDAYLWFLHHERHPGDHMLTVVTLRHWVSAHVCSLKFLEPAMELMSQLGITSTDTISRRVIMNKEQCSSWNKMTASLRAVTMLVHGDYEVQLHLSDRAFLGAPLAAVTFADTYQMTFKHAMRAIRTLCLPLGFLPLGKTVFDEVVAKNKVPEDCLTELRDVLTVLAQT